MTRFTWIRKICSLYLTTWGRAKQSRGSTMRSYYANSTPSCKKTDTIWQREAGFQYDNSPTYISAIATTKLIQLVSKLLTHDWSYFSKLALVSVLTATLHLNWMSFSIEDFEVLITLSILISAKSCAIEFISYNDASRSIIGTCSFVILHCTNFNAYLDLLCFRNFNNLGISWFAQDMIKKYRSIQFVYYLKYLLNGAFIRLCRFCYLEPTTVFVIG